MAPTAVAARKAVSGPIHSQPVAAIQTFEFNEWAACKQARMEAATNQE
jgi:hypothetical protein